MNTIFIPLARHENQLGGETVAARRLRDHEPGFGVWRLSRIPICAALHIGDVIVCDESDPDRIPYMTAVLEYQPMVTVYLVFTYKGYMNRDVILAEIDQAGFHTERVEGKLWVINVNTDRLDELELFLAPHAPHEIRSWKDEDTPEA